MGFIREQFGRITVESRRESFMIHVEDASLREPSSEWWTADLGDLIAALTDYRDSLAARDTRAALAGVSAEATPERGGVGAIDDGPVGQERSGESVVAPPPNPYPLGGDFAEAWGEGFAAGLAAERAEVVRRLGGYGGPLYLADPNQGEVPDYHAAVRLLREIVVDLAAGLAARDTPDGER